MEGKNIVLSYKNPDTDGVACSIGMATLLTTEDEKWEPMVIGAIGKETQYVLQKTGISIPEEISSFDDVERIVLVDTHHIAQLPEHFPCEKVTLIIDHHPNGNDEAFPNAKIINEKIGAAASIVAEKLIKKGLPDADVTLMLGCAIISNTLNFTAPSTAEYDCEMFEKVNDIVVVPEQVINEMFEKRSSILKEDIYDALNSDFKIFETEVGSVGISQIEAYNLDDMIDIQQAVAALEKIAKERKLEYCMFNGVDIKTQKSIVLAANSDSADLICKIFNIDQYAAPIKFDRILLRKTDFVPPLNV